MVKGIIFDLDGTLLNTLKDIGESMNKALVLLGYKGHDIDDYKHFVGNGVKNLSKSVLPEIAADDTDIIAELMEKYDKIYWENKYNKTKPYSGIVKLLEKLKEQKILIFVISNKPDKFTKEMVEYYFGNIFTEVAGQRDDFPRKPEPDLALHFCEKYDIIPSEMFFIGDSEADMRTAKNAKIPAIGVLWGFRDEKELTSTGADYIVKDPSEILAIINETEPEMVL